MRILELCQSGSGRRAFPHGIGELVLALTLAIFSPPGVRAAQDLTELSLEELMEIEVTTIGRRERALAQTPAAVYVLTREEIRRSGMTSIPDLLRMVPGLHVAQTSGHSWSVSCRGFNGEFAAKMLVMIDGRSIDTPLGANVVWELRDLHLEDIERIEVMRGPSATTWGANALNGVVNVVTRSAKDTTGGLATVRVGNLEREAAVRFGGQAGGRFHYRFFGKLTDQDSFAYADGTDADDRWRKGSGGVRIDWDLSARDALMVVGGIGRGEFDQMLSLPSLSPPYTQTQRDRYQVTSGDVLAEWRRRHRSGAATVLRVAVDHFDQNDLVYQGRMNRVDVEFERQRDLGSRHSVTWGAGYRLTSAGSLGTDYFEVASVRDRLQRWRAFVEDEIRLPVEDVFLTLSAMAEHNTFGGLVVMPTARLLWEPKPKQIIWLAASQAGREPVWSEVRGRSWSAASPPMPHSGGLPVGIKFVGLEEEDSRSLQAFEAGYRTRLRRDFSVDLAAFYNRYDKLRLLGFLPASMGEVPEPHLVQPMQGEADGSMSSWGVEAAAHWTPTDWWELRGTYGWLNQRIDPSPEERVIEIRRMPSHQSTLRSGLNLPGRMQLDTSFYYTDTVPDQGVTPFYYPPVPWYVRLDTRLSWRATPQLELSLVGQNLLDDHHAELNPQVVTIPSEVRRSVFLRVSWEF